jgi:hypothetical protein
MMMRTPTPEGVTLTAVLEGCPDDLASDQKIKILHHGGYEHFERVAQSAFDSERRATFRWVMHTKIAE